MEKLTKKKLVLNKQAKDKWMILEITESIWEEFLTI